MLAVQEPTPRQWPELLEAIGKDYAGLYESRLDYRWPDSHGEAIFYRRDRFTLQGRDVFWISDTPEVPGSLLQPNQWGQRITLTASLHDRAADKDLLFACTHFDTHPDSWLPAARVVSAELARRVGGQPVILTGDFNCAVWSPAWRWFTQDTGWTDAWHGAGMSDAGVVTFNAFIPRARLPLESSKELLLYLEEKHGGADHDKHYPPHILEFRNERIDWILFKGPFRTLDAAVDTRLRDGRCASDHFAVSATLDWT